MKKLLTLASLSLAASFLAPEPRAEAQGASGPTQLEGVPVALGCKNPGSSQDVSKTPHLVNETSFAIPKGRTLTWKASDGDSGSVKLEADLAPGASIQGMGKPGNGYSCSGTYVAYPDLTVASVVPSHAGYVVKVQNLDPHASAIASLVSVQFFACGTNVALGAGQARVASLAAGGSTTVTVAVTKPSAKSYFVVSSDAGRQIVEGSESNNLQNNQPEACVP